MHYKIYHKITEHLTAKQPSWLVTVIDVSGSSPGKVGFKMLVDNKGAILGTIGGGKVEQMVMQKILTAQPQSAVCWHFDLGEKGVAKDKKIRGEKTGMVCGGGLEVLVEPLFSGHALYIIGAGHCGQALSELASKCDFAVTVIDDRAEFVTEAYHPYAAKLICTPYANTAQHIKFGAETYIVIMTHAHSHDEVVLRQVVDKEYRYLGVIGSKNKAQTVFEHLLRDGYEEKMLRRVFSPIGLRIGSQTPYEIAVSIMAQILAVRNDISDIAFKAKI